MAIYTRTGDKGMTGLSNGERVSKADLRVEVLGTIDELNSAIGVAIAELGINDKGLMIKEELIKIQSDLFNIGTILANPTINHELRTMNYFAKRVKEFEDFIDEMTTQMPKLSNFILPGGGKTGAALHLARAVCRRAERGIVELNHKSSIINHKSEAVLVYFNRLSDLLFTLARFVNFKEKRKERVWSAK